MENTNIAFANIPFSNIQSLDIQNQNVQNSIIENSKELHLKFVRLGMERQKLEYKLIALLPEIFKTGIFKKYAKDIYEYAGRFGGISRSAVEKRLRLEKNLEGKPTLKEAIEKVGIHKVALVATLANTQNEHLFAYKALNMSKSALSTLSKELRNTKETFGDVSNHIEPCCAKPQTITLELDTEMTFLFLKFKKKFSKKFQNLSNMETMKKILEIVNENGFVNTLKNAKVVGIDALKPAKVITGDGNLDEKSIKKCDENPITSDRSRYIPAKLKRETIADGKCNYYNCSKPADHIHHQNRYSITKNHSDIIALCKDHHEFMHNGLIENETASTECWAMNLAKTEDGVDRQYREIKNAARRKT